MEGIPTWPWNLLFDNGFKHGTWFSSQIYGNHWEFSKMMSFPEFGIAWGGHMKRAPVDFPVLDLPMSKSRLITELEGISSGGLILSLDPYVCPL